MGGQWRYRARCKDERAMMTGGKVREEADHRRGRRGTERWNNSMTVVVYIPLSSTFSHISTTPIPMSFFLFKAPLLSLSTIKEGIHGY